MQTLGILSQKGGAGKTTLAVHIAVAAQQAGFRVAVVDLDPQGTARKWGARRDAEPEVVGDHAEQLAALKTAAAENGADLLIIDTAPNADRSSLLAAKACDFILIPCRPNKFDIEAIEATTDVAALAKKPAAVVINSAPHGKNGLPDPAVAEAVSGLRSQGVVVAPQVIEQRVAFSHAVNDGRTALELDPRGKASKELRALFAWTCQQAGLQTGQRARKAA
jgi:chromosome partitioning protein